MKAAGKKAKRTPRNLLLAVSVITFLISSILYFSVTVIFKTYDNHLAAQMQLLQEQITAIQLENEEASNEVERLAAEQRVTSISSTALTYQGNNVVTIDEDK